MSGTVLMTVFWDMTPHRFEDKRQRFGRTCCLLVRTRRWCDLKGIGLTCNWTAHNVVNHNLGEGRRELEHGPGQPENGKAN